jgi:HAD superfamily hydrolase (TIGR01509 family)
MAPVQWSEMEPNSRLRVVAFDLDGTIFNTEELYWEVGGLLLARRGKQVTRELLDQMMGRPSRVALQLMIDHHELDATVADLQAETTSAFTTLLDTRLSLNPGLLELLDALDAARMPRCIATSSSRAFLDDVLRRFDLASRFDFALTAEDVAEGKPHPEIYLQAARRLQVAPAEMLVLEDSENGCRAAVSAGAYTVAVPGEHSRQHNFAGVDLIAQGLADERIYAALGLPRPLV